MNSGLTKTLVILSIFAVAMGYMESAVVVYLRKIYYPDGFSLPLKSMDMTLGLTEFFREAVTICMLVTVAMLITKRWLFRFAWFIYAFAIWDISYYLFLYLILGWPPTLLTWDVLFIFPVIWTGPVLAPLINSLSMIMLAFLILRLNRSGKDHPLSRWQWTLLISGSVLTVFTYISAYPRFNWLIFILAESLFLLSFLLFLKKTGSPQSL